jgi:chromate reductase, NAD(P)H dehydrogenase (quinone)
MMTEQRALQVLALPGSLRAGSYNRRLLEIAGELAAPGVRVEIYGLESLPLYNRDVETEGDPPAVAQFKEAISASDAVLVATPEYNAGTTGVLKNAIDWASRPPGESVLGNKPVAILGGGGRGGTRRAQGEIRAALEHPGARVLDKREVAVVRVREKFDPEGELTDDAVRESIRSLVAGLVAEGRQAIASGDGAPTRQTLLAAA